MIILRLLGAAMCFCSSVGATKVLSLRRSVDPDIIADAATAGLMADYAELYSTLKEDYVEQGCIEKWGEFPSPTSTNLRHPSKEEMKNKVKGGMICNCGMLYDLALSALPRNEDLYKDDEEENIAFTAIEDFTGIDYGARLDSSKPVTQLDAWAMARKPNGETKCKGGSAGGYPCKNVDLIAHLPLNSLKTSNTNQAPRTANDVWGWTSNNGREFVIWGVREGMYFFEVRANNSSDPLVLLGFLPSGGYGLQHDVKVIGDFAYIGAEVASHGMQIFDMKRLLKIQPSKHCNNDKYCQSLTPDRLYRGNAYAKVGNSHNIVVNEETKYVYIVGSASCKGGLHVVDVYNPLNPQRVACFAQGGYTHDAQCVIYDGPDPKYKGKEICFCFNEDSVDIVDVSEKDNMRRLSSTSYTAVDYTHQGWLSTDRKYIVFGDEGDEYFDLTKRTRTLVLNVENLENPKSSSIREYYGSTAASDHNQYVINARDEGQGYTSNSDLIYQANYEAGMRILQVIDYKSANFKEIGYFDTYPLSNNNKFQGAWSVFPYFASGVVVISSIDEGLFLVKPKLHSDLGVSNVNVECNSDEPLAYKGNKDCGWVGKVKPGKKASFNRIRTRRRCKKTHIDGQMLHNWCKKTCGLVGIGKCKAIDTKIKKK